MGQSINGDVVMIAMEPNIGLDEHARQSLVALLNVALADEVVLVTKTRNAHWNTSGKNFLELRSLFDRQVKQLLWISDKVAERTRILGGVAFGSLHEYLHVTRLVDQSGQVPDVLHLLADQEALIRFLRLDAAKSRDEHEDEGTFHLLTTVIRQHERMAWMLRSFNDSKQS